MALPHMVGGEGETVCLSPILEQIIGHVGGARRWAHFLTSGSRTAVEFQAAWETMAGEASHICTYLEEEKTGPLAMTTEEAGGNRTDGSTRGLVVKQLEGLRHKMLAKALVRHPDRTARPVTAFPNISDDKCAGAWLLATPTSQLSMSSPVFKEALSAHLCLPSPAVRDGGWLGKTIGRTRVEIDQFGDAVMNCHEIVGDSWRRRHDGLKNQLVAEAVLSGIPVDCEVYGLFSNLLPAELEQEGGELRWGRARQGKVPDLKLLLDTPEGPEQSLAELKFISAGRTWFPRGQQGKGTDRRLQGEYEAALRAFDVRFHGAQPLRQGQPEPPPGPLVRRLRSFGPLLSLVAGPWGDLSQDLHRLLRIFAEARVANRARAEGWGGVGAEDMGQAMGEVRRATSVAVVRLQALCLLERLAHLGPGARAAGERRRVVKQLEERRRREAEAYRLAHLNLGLGREGRAFVP